MRHNAELYDHDFYTWTQETAALIAAGKWHEIDQARLQRKWPDWGATSSERWPGACSISSRSCSSGGRCPGNVKVIGPPLSLKRARVWRIFWRIRLG